MVRYSAAFLGWSRLQLEEIDRRTKKLQSMHNGFHPKSDIAHSIYQEVKVAED